MPAMPRRLAALLAPLTVALAAGPALADGKVEAKRTLNADGTTSYSYSSALDDLGAVFGMDLSRAASSAAPTVAAGASDLGGTAYAKFALPELPAWMLWQKSTVNLTIDPTDAHSKVGTTFSRTVSLGEGLDATLADTYKVNATTQAWETDKSLSLKLAETGTTFSLGARATADAPTLAPTLSAQQKVLGNINVTTSVAESGSSLTRSITAGFSQRW